jgi:hypothetical protein
MQAPLPELRSSVESSRHWQYMFELMFNCVVAMVSTAGPVRAERG